MCIRDSLKGRTLRRPGKSQLDMRAHITNLVHPAPRPPAGAAVRVDERPRFDATGTHRRTTTYYG
eukprot:2088148-Alexandrium_andersonii.AAC.1